VNSFLITKVASQSDNWTVILNALIIDIAIKPYFNLWTSERLKIWSYLFIYMYLYS